MRLGAMRRMRKVSVGYFGFARNARQRPERACGDTSVRSIDGLYAVLNARSVG